MTNQENTGNRSGMESALYCVAVMSRMLSNPLQMDQIRHQFDNGADRLNALELARVFNEMGFKSLVKSKDLARLSPEVLPAILATKAGGYLIMAKMSPQENQAFVQMPGALRGKWLPLTELTNVCTGEVILVKKKAMAGQEGQEENQFGLGWFMRASLKYRSILRDCFLASFFVQVFALASPLIFMLVIDKVLNHNSLSTLDVLVFALIVITLFEIALNALRTYLMSHTANRIDLMLGMRLFKHLLSLPLNYFETRRVGDTIARMRELDTVRQFITGSGLMSFLDLFFVLVFLAVMFLFSTYLTLIVVCVMPLLFLTSFLITPILRGRLEDKYSIGANNQSFLVEVVSGIETIKSSAAEPRIKQRWEERLSSFVKSGFSSGQISNLNSQVTTIISKALTVGLLYMGAKEVMAGDLTVGQLIAFNMLSARVVAPILRLSQIWKEYQQVKVATRRIADILGSPAEAGFSAERVQLPEIQGKVQFEDVSFRYRPDGPAILSDISFTVEPGEVIGIVGSTGSGKTTLVKLLQRLYVPERGKVLVDDYDISLADASWLRRQIGVVVQDGVLFNGSILENITFNNSGIEMEKVIDASKLAGAHEFITKLPNGYDTQVGERGCQLSTGQRQRIAIARALTFNPRMLIFDEATSFLDYESEQRVQRNMKKICEGRTVFVVAHRLSTVRHADRILTIEGGKLIENDSPEALITRGGRYATLHAIQDGSHA